MADLNALNPVTDINNVIALINQSPDYTIRPEVFYTKQLLDTIRLDAEHFVYFRYADESPIPDKSKKLTLRRWAPLQAHIVPLNEGVPPKSDKGSVESYELEAFQYGRYMEFTDKVDFEVVDPIVAHYTKEYAIVAIETLDMLAREELLSKAQKRFAGGATNITGMRIATGKPSIADLRLVVLSLKKLLVKPRSNGKFHVLCSPEFTFDMIDDPYVKLYMQLNQKTSPMYDNTTLVPMFDMEFYETMACPTSGEFVDADGKKSLLIYKPYEQADAAEDWADTKDDDGFVYRVINEDSKDASDKPLYTTADGYVKDSRTGEDASYIPGLVTWKVPTGWTELKVQHTLVLGKDALTRTGLAGEGNAKTYVKPLGSAGVLDPIDQRQSIGFKINSVGFGSTRLEAIVDYVNIPSQLNV